MSNDATRSRLIKLADWLYSDSPDDTPIEQVEAELIEAGVDLEQMKVRMKEMISRLSRKPAPNPESE